ncbi:MAG: ABC transporter substrate-binding protein [Alphaproteobacteria bacterium]
MVTHALRSILRSVALFAAGLGVLGIGSQSAYSQTQPVKVGAVLPYSGNLAWYGQEIGRGYELAVKTINARGGINGRPVELAKADAPAATAAIGEVERLKNQGVKVIIGSGSSAVALAGSAAAAKHDIFYWETNGLDNAYSTRGLKNAFQFAPNNDDFVEVSISLLSDLGPKMLNKPLKDITVGLAYENSTYGMTQSKVQKEHLAKLGVKVVVDQSYSRTASDLSPVVLQLRSANPDIVIETGYQDDIVLMWRQAKELGYLPKMLISSGAAATQDFANALGDKGVDGFIAYNYPFHEMPESGAPGAAEFAKAYQAAYGAPPPSGHSLAGYAGMIALADVIKAAGSDAFDAMVKAAHATDKPRGSYANGAGVKFNAGGRNERAPVHGFQWQGGKLYTIYPAAVANSTPKGPLTPWDKR